MNQTEIQLSIPARLGFEKIAMETVVSLAALHGLPSARFSDVRTAISEACINAMEHGNKFARGTSVEIHMRVQRRNLQIDILDLGKGLKGPLVQPDLQRKLAGEESPRGWGAYLIEKLVDDVHYFYHKKRNVTQLSFKLPGKRQNKINEAVPQV
ncbi:MAG: ATP-binding protein [Calditrichaeota bacterium]|nr:MAG: ATP-binding protein [Calditrichota bacterium]